MTNSPAGLPAQIDRFVVCVGKYVRALGCALDANTHGPAEIARLRKMQLAGNWGGVSNADMCIQALIWATDVMGYRILLIRDAAVPLANDLHSNGLSDAARYVLTTRDYANDPDNAGRALLAFWPKAKQCLQEAALQLRLGIERESSSVTLDSAPTGMEDDKTFLQRLLEALQPLHLNAVEMARLQAYLKRPVSFAILNRAAQGDPEAMTERNRRTRLEKIRDFNKALAENMGDAVEPKPIETLADLDNEVVNQRVKLQDWKRTGIPWDREKRRSYNGFFAAGRKVLMGTARTKWQEECAPDPEDEGDRGQYERDLQLRHKLIDEQANPTPAKSQTKQMPWDESVESFIPASKAVEMSAGVISLSKLSKMLTPEGCIRYMRKPRRCRVHVQDFLAEIRRIPGNESVAEEAARMFGKYQSSFAKKQGRK